MSEETLEIKAIREGYRAQLAEVEKRYDGSIEALIKVRKERDAWRKLALKLTTSLEYAHIALAVQADELLAYKDHYGTSVAQVRHLSACHRCESYGQEAPDTTYRCPDYPTE